MRDPWLLCVGLLLAPGSIVLAQDGPGEEDGGAEQDDLPVDLIKLLTVPVERVLLHRT